MKYTVTSPVQNFTGLVGGVSFHQGKAEVDSKQLRELSYFNRKGYTVTPAGADTDEDTDDGVKRPTNSAPKPDWVAYAVALGADEAEANAETKDALIATYGG